MQGDQDSQQKQLVLLFEWQGKAIDDAAGTGRFVGGAGRFVGGAGRFATYLCMKWVCGRVV